MAFNDSIAADATLRVEVLYMDPEDHRFENAPPPYVRMVCAFLSKGDLLARYEFTAIGSREKNINNRLSECFARGGQMLAKNIVKK